MRVHTVLVWKNESVDCDYNTVQQSYPLPSIHCICARFTALLLCLAPPRIVLSSNHYARQVAHAHFMCCTLSGKRTIAQLVPLKNHVLLQP